MVESFFKMEKEEKNILKGGKQLAKFLLNSIGNICISIFLLCFLEKSKQFDAFLAPYFHYVSNPQRIHLFFLGFMAVWTYAVTGTLAIYFRVCETEEGFDNNKPRKYRELLTGVSLRAQAAHQNMLENFP